MFIRLDDDQDKVVIFSVKRMRSYATCAAHVSGGFAYL